ncbi:MLO-like protein 3 [Glycine soja]|nr:MLO-like protein 3 [Glycine soja]
MAAGYASGYSLQHTPTWAIALVSFILISISIILEHLIHLIIQWLRKNRRSDLVEAIERLKSELMILGFMSLLLTVTQDAIIEICIPVRAADTMLPCRKLTSNDTAILDSCSAKNASKVALVSKHGIHQLHMFIFVLALMQIVYSFLTVSLARAKMRHWKAWDEETQTVEYEIANDVPCTTQAHFSARNNDFDFQNYIEQSLEEDFRIIVSISPVMWFTVVIFLLVDVHGWHVYLWLSYVPLLLVLVVGAKLEVIVDQMALKMKDVNNVTKGTPLVCPSDKFFWFGHPGFVLTLLHYTLFVGSRSSPMQLCYSPPLCTSGTGKLYLDIDVLVCDCVRMGSEVKSKALAKMLKQWHLEVRERRRNREQLKSFSFRHTNMSSEWSQENKSAPDFSSTLCESIRSSDEGEIVEELEHMEKTKASSSSDPPCVV